MAKVYLAETERWQAAYIDGELLCQDHYVDLEDIVVALGHEYEERWFNQDELRGSGSFPSELGEWSGSQAR